eukprot:m.69696 g.69696  ORF g.69696 m.69696 type:complete len:1225 (+) comp8601_c0_seq1:40-3714(+)
MAGANPFLSASAPSDRSNNPFATDGAQSTTPAFNPFAVAAAPSTNDDPFATPAPTKTGGDGGTNTANDRPGSLSPMTAAFGTLKDDTTAFAFGSFETSDDPFATPAPTSGAAPAAATGSPFEPSPFAAISTTTVSPVKEAAAVAIKEEEDNDTDASSTTTATTTLTAASTDTGATAASDTSNDESSDDPKLAKKRAKEEKKRQKVQQAEAKKKARESKGKERLSLLEKVRRRKSSKAPTADSPVQPPTPTGASTTASMASPETTPAAASTSAATASGGHTAAPNPFAAVPTGASAADGSPPIPDNLKESDAVSELQTLRKIATDLALTEDQLNLYGELFRTEAGDGDTVGADKAVPLFQTSGLHPGVLETIWNIADTDEPLGELDFREFCVSLKLISLKQADVPPLPENLGKPSPTAKVDKDAMPSGSNGPTALPDYVNLPGGVAADSGRSQDDAATAYANGRLVEKDIIPAGQEDVYERLWEECAGAGADKVQAGSCVEFFTTSKLPKKSLKKIWNVADHIPPLGQLCKLEFVIASKLIALQQNGMGPPTPKQLYVEAPPPRMGSNPVDEHGDYHDHVGFPLSDEEETVYTQLWGEVDKVGGGADATEETATAGVIADYLKSSLLPSRVLKRIWELCDTGEAGKMNKQEFFAACKLVAVAQSGEDLDIEMLTHATPLPAVGSRAPSPSSKTVTGSTSGGTATSTDSDPFTGLVRTGGLDTAAERSKSSSVKNAKSLRRKPTRRKNADRGGALQRRQNFERLCLTAQEEHVYEALWIQAAAAASTPTSSADGDTVARSDPGMSAFWSTAELDANMSDTIWSLADVAEPKQSLCREEFFVALKLVALAQAGQDVDLANVSKLTPLPRIGEPVAPLVDDAGTTTEDPKPPTGPRPGFGNIFGGGPPQLPSKGGSGTSTSTSSRPTGGGGAVPAGGSGSTGGTAGPKPGFGNLFGGGVPTLPKKKKPAVAPPPAKSSPKVAPKVAPKVTPRASPSVERKAAPVVAVPGVATALGLSEADVVAYEKLWAEADTNGGILTAGSAVTFLGTSGLDKAVLRTIWGLSDTETPRGQLDKDEFFLACKLVAMAQAGKALDDPSLRSQPTALPKLGSLAPGAHGSGDDGGLPHIARDLGLSAQHVAAYEKLWMAADTHGGFLAAGAAVKFLGTSGLDQSTLREIWELADTDVPRGRLDRDEFFVACKLVAIAQAGIPLAGADRTHPTALPHFAL